MRFTLRIGTGVWIILGLFYGAHSWAQEAASAVASLADHGVSGFTVLAGGSGYRTVPTVELTGGGGTGAKGTAVLKGSRVAAIVVTDSGSGYTEAPAVKIAPPPKIARLSLRNGASLMVDGTANVSQRVEWSATPTGPWSPWTNVVLNGAGSTSMSAMSGDAV